MQCPILWRQRQWLSLLRLSPSCQGLEFVSSCYFLCRPHISQRRKRDTSELILWPGKGAVRCPNGSQVNMTLVLEHQGAPGLSYFQKSSPHCCESENYPVRCTGLPSALSCSRRLPQQPALSMTDATRSEGILTSCHSPMSSFQWT